MGTRTMDIAYADCVNSVSLHPRFIEYNLLSAMVQELGLCHLQFSIHGGVKVGTGTMDYSIFIDFRL